MRDICDIRLDINRIDDDMRALFLKRMKLAYEIAEYKKSHRLPVLDEKREAEIIDKNLRMFDDPSLADYYEKFLESVMDISKKYQNSVISRLNSDV